MIIILLIIFSINTVYAEEELEITKNVEIRYKWYKDVIKGEFLPKKNITKDDLVDENRIKYGEYSNWHENNCKVSLSNYDVSVVTVNHYKKIDNIRYILVEDFNSSIDNLKIYYNTEPIAYAIISNDNNRLKIDLKKAYLSEKLLFYIETIDKAKIGLYSTYDFSKELLSKEIDAEKVVIPDKTWITPQTSYIIYSTEEILANSDLTTKTGWNYLCRNREIYVYKYEIEREYYDDNYHTYVEGYTKDLNDYKIYYKGEPITNTIEITKEKIVKDIQTKYEYIYLENEKNKLENDSSQKVSCTQKIKREIIEKKIYKTPKVIFVVIILLLIMIIFLITKLHKKYVVEKK